MECMRFKIWLEGMVDDDTKRRIYEKATTTGIPVRRGEKPRLAGRAYATDAGDFGRGIYYSTHYHRAKSYGPVTKSVIKFSNPLVLTAEESYALANQFHTVILPEEDLVALRSPKQRESRLLANAEALTRYMLSQGHDGLIVVDRGVLEIVDYRPYR